MPYFPPCLVFVNLIKVLKMIFFSPIRSAWTDGSRAPPPGLCFSRAEDHVGVTALPLAAEKKTYLLLMTLLIKGSATIKRDIQMSSFAVQRELAAIGWT